MAGQLSSASGIFSDKKRRVAFSGGELQVMGAPQVLRLSVGELNTHSKSWY